MSLLTVADASAAVHKRADAHQQQAVVPSPAVYDFSVLPEFSGTVAQYIPDPFGGVSGLLLTNGTQILCSPDIASSITSLTRAGSTISGRGLQARQLPMIRAFTLTGPTGRTVEDDGLRLPLNQPDITPGPDIPVEGEVLYPLYNLHGAITGVILKNHAIIRIAPNEVSKLQDILTPGKIIRAFGPGHSGSAGTAIIARQIGLTTGNLISLTPEALIPPGAAPGSPDYDVIPGTNVY